MKTISVSDATKQLTKLVSALDEGPVLLLRNGRPCAALVGLDEQFDKEAFSLGRNKRLRQLIDDACKRTGRKNGVPFSEIVAEVEGRAARAKTRVSQGHRRLR